MKTRIFVRSPKDVVPLLAKYTRKKTEHFGVICMNSQYEVISEKRLFMGSVNSCTVDPKIIFWEACKKNASAMIIYHNHPSGNTEPSKQDVTTTLKLKGCCELMNISLLDHIIVGRYDYYSFLENECVLSTHDEEVKVAERG